MAYLYGQNSNHTTMKRILGLLLSCFVMATSQAQSLEDINEMMGKLQYAQAKTAIDKYFQNPKKANDAEGHYYKGRIYNSLSHDSSMSNNQQYTLKTEAFNAFKTNQQLDPKDVYLTLEAHMSYLDLYYSFYDLGAKQYNTKEFDAAANSFKMAMEVKDYILSKKIQYAQVKLPVIDTGLIQNIAITFVQANKEEEGIKYYEMLSAANVAGEEFKDMYQYLLGYYLKSNNMSAFQNLLSKVKSTYPKYIDDWIDQEIQVVVKTGDRQALFAKYEQLINENPTRFVLPYNYAVELYNTLYGKDAAATIDPAISAKLTEVIKKAIANEDKSEISATMLMTNHLYNLSGELINSTNAVKGTKPEDVKKKNDLKTAANKTMDDCILYAETALKFYEAISTPTAGQKANHRILLGYLSDIYGLKKNAAKAAEYDKKKTML
jgi:hypothetical protein